MAEPGAKVTPYGRAARLVGSAAAVRIAAAVFTSVAGLLIAVLAVRLLGPSRYGTLAFALSMVGLASGLSRLGLGPATVRSVAAAQERGPEALAGILRGAFTALTATALSATLVVAVALGVTSQGISPIERTALTAGVAVFLLGRMLATSNQWIAVGLGRVSWMEVGNLTISLVLVVGLGVLSLLDRSQLGAVGIAYAGAGLAGATVSAWSLRRVTGHVERALRVSIRAGGSLLRIAAPYAVAGATMQIISQFDVFVLGLTGTRAEVGGYEPALRLVDRLATLVPFVFVTGFVPAATRLLTRDRLDDFRALYVTVSTAVYVLAAPALILLVAFPDLTMAALFGEGFPVRASITWVLLLGYGTHLVFGLNTAALSATGRRRTIALVYGITLLFMAVAALALIPALGPLGAATATALSYVWLNVAVSVAVHRHTGAHVFAPRTVVVMGSSGVPMLIGFLLRAQIDSFPTAVVTVLALWALWGVLLVATRMIPLADIRSLLPHRTAEQGSE